MSILDGFALVRKAYTERDKEKWYRVWLVRQPSDGKHVTPFDTWYEELFKQAKEIEYSTELTNDEIVARCKEIENKAVK